MTKELLERIEKLETFTQRLGQAIQDIWASCSCLRKEIEEEGSEFNCELPEEIEEEKPEEPQEEDYE